MIIQQQSLRHPEILAKRNAFFMKVRLKTVLTAKTLSQNGLTIVATPQSFIYGDKIKIILSLDTHSGDLSFDLTKVTTLIDSSGTSYIPTVWTGTLPGGHHSQGTLTFPSLEGRPSSMELTIKNIYGADWRFEWNLQTKVHKPDTIEVNRGEIN